MKFRKITSEILRYWARVDLRILALTSTIVAQLVLLIWIIGNGEWILHRGVQVRLQIEALDPYDPVRGNRFEFVPSIFRHSFPCQAPIAPGQMVMVAPTEKGFSNWAVTT
ncbi:hypothetical protein EBR96_03560, partial [bacterium]|nr:hypothetical protein [bacterium]